MLLVCLQQNQSSVEQGVLQSAPLSNLHIAKTQATCFTYIRSMASAAPHTSDKQFMVTHTQLHIHTHTASCCCLQGQPTGTGTGYSQGTATGSGTGYNQGSGTGYSQGAGTPGFNQGTHVGQTQGAGAGGTPGYGQGADYSGAGQTRTHTGIPDPQVTAPAAVTLMIVHVTRA